MRFVLAAVSVSLVAVAAALAGPAQAGTRQGQTKLYAKAYAVDQGWVLTTFERVGADDRHARYVLRFLANPAAGAEHCYDDVVTVDSCPAQWYTGDFPFYMKVEAVTAKCGPGWFVVSTPLDPNTCRRFVLPAWTPVKTR